MAVVFAFRSETVNIINEKTIAMMKNGAYLINVGRGDAIDQNALLSALRTGKLAGAAIDVTTPDLFQRQSSLE